MYSLPLQKNVGEENLFVHDVPLFRISKNYECKAFSWRPCCTAKDTAEQNSKFQETSFTLFLLFISVLLYYKSHFRQTYHLYSSAPLHVA